MPDPPRCDPSCSASLTIYDPHELDDCNFLVRPEDDEVAEDVDLPCGQPAAALPHHIGRARPRRAVEALPESPVTTRHHLNSGTGVIPMSEYEVVATERWSVRVSYEVEAPNEAEAVRMVKDHQVSVQTYTVIWEDHMEVDEILSVESASERFAVARFNWAGAQVALETDNSPRTLQQVAQEALDIQDACNLCDVAQSFAQLCVELTNRRH